jgi:signal transduction histidine kinase
MAHRTRVHRLLANLVENAVKFSRGEAPRVAVTSRDAADGTCRVEVRDDGLGIEPGVQEDLFKPLRRFHAHLDIPGSGLGLAICRRIVHGYEGEIDVRSRPDTGTVVGFTLPLAPVAPAGAGAAGADAVPLPTADTEPGAQ